MQRSSHLQHMWAKGQADALGGLVHQHYPRTQGVSHGDRCLPLIAFEGSRQGRDVDGPEEQTQEAHHKAILIIMHTYTRHHEIG